MTFSFWAYPINYLFALAVKGRGGLVKKQDSGVLDDGAGDGDPLFLAAGQLQTARAHFGEISLRETFDKLSDTHAHTYTYTHQHGTKEERNGR